MLVHVIQNFVNPNKQWITTDRSEGKKSFLGIGNERFLIVLKCCSFQGVCVTFLFVTILSNVSFIISDDHSVGY